MEYLEGGTLQQATSIFRFEENHIAYITKEMLSALQYLHSLFLIHRDLKSANVMLSISGRAKLIDFGLCINLQLIKEEDRKNLLQMVGSPFWIPPEMIKREPHSYSADIYSMAVCVLELANGTVPNSSSPIFAMWKAATSGIEEPFKKPQRWSDQFKDFITLCLNQNPSLRPSPQELLKHPFIKSSANQTLMKKVFNNIFMSKGFADGFGF